MALNYVTLILDGFDGGGTQLTRGTATFTPSVLLTDPTDQEWIPLAPVSATFREGLAAPQVSLLATDNANVLPSGWGWKVSFLNVPGSPAPFDFFLPFASGSTQRLSQLQPVQSVTTMAAYMPLPTGTAAAGYVPTATGNGEASQWAPSGTGGSGYPSSPVVSGTPTTGQVLTATSSTTADWQTPSSGGGGITPPAGDIGGTTGSPTVVSTHLSSPLPIAQGGTGQGTQQAAIDALAGAVTSGSYLRGNGTHVVLAAIQAADVPTLNQDTTGKSAKTDALDSATTVVNVSAATAPTTGQVLTATDSTHATWQNVPSGFSNPMTTKGDIIVEDATPAPARLAGPTSATKQFLTSTGTGVAANVPAWGTIAAGDVPTLNQNTTGTAANVTGTVAIANGGTGQTTQQAALDAIAGAVTSGRVLRGDGTHVTLAALQASDVPTLNQSTTGTAANVTGTVAIGNGGTGQTTQQAAMDALAGAVTSAQFLRGNGTHVVMAAISAGDVPTLNQNTTGSSASCTGNAATATNLAGGATLPAYLAPKAIALTFGATINVDASLGNAFNLTLTASTGTIANPTNPVDGEVIRFRISQDATGSRTVAWGTAYDFGTAGAPTLTTTASKVDIIGFEYVSSISKWCYVGSGLGF